MTIRCTWFSMNETDLKFMVYALAIYDFLLAAKM